MPFVGPLKLSVKLFCSTDIAMGPGKADVLEAIDRTGSISAAGRTLGMSYRRTWVLVRTMNRCWTEPLVQTSPGGGAHRGAQLTICGRQVLSAYRDLERRLEKAAWGLEMETLNQLLLETPRTAEHEHGGETEQST